MANESGPLTGGEVLGVAHRVADLSDRAHEHGDTIMWMVLHCAAESIRDAWEQREEMLTDGD